MENRIRVALSDVWKSLEKWGGIDTAKPPLIEDFDSRDIGEGAMSIQDGEEAPWQLSWGSIDHEDAQSFIRFAFGEGRDELRFLLKRDGHWEIIHCAWSGRTHIERSPINSQLLELVVKLEIHWGMRPTYCQTLE